MQSLLLERAESGDEQMFGVERVGAAGCERLPPIGNR